MLQFPQKIKHLSSWWRLVCVSYNTSAEAAANGHVADNRLKLDDPKEAYKSKSTSQLLRAYLVFRMCSVSTLVDKQMSVSVTYVNIYLK